MQKEEPMSDFISNGRIQQMTLDQFLRKYNKCPFCRSYVIQGNLCYVCKWRFGHGQYAKETDFDLFDPKESWRELMNREVDG